MKQVGVSIRVDTALGVGTTFDLFFPAPAAARDADHSILASR